MLQWATIDTPVGEVSVACSDKGVAEVRFGRSPAGGAGQGAFRADGLLSAAHDQLSEYFGQAREGFDLPLDWSHVAGARQRVLALLAETVPYGETITYGALAHRLALRDGRPAMGSRVVGRIMGSNPIPVIVPCHRVVAADGLGGFSGGCGIELKRWLLTFEGALPAMLDFGTPVLPVSRSRAGG